MATTSSFTLTPSASQNAAALSGMGSSTSSSSSGGGSSSSKTTTSSSGSSGSSSNINSQYLIDSYGNVTNKSSGQYIDQSTFQKLGLNASLIPKTTTVYTGSGAVQLTTAQPTTTTPTTTKTTSTTTPAASSTNSSFTLTPTAAQNQSVLGGMAAPTPVPDQVAQQIQTATAYTPPQATNANNAYYKDAQGNVYDTATGAPITQAQFKQLGLNIDHLNTLDQIQANQGMSPQEQAFRDAQANGESVPTSEEGVYSLMSQYGLNGQADPGAQVISSDPYLNTLVSAYRAYTDPANQKASLVDTYNQMLSDSGIQGIDSQLLNMKNVIDGTEDDIRTEVTKAGGFATDSQVVALANARNKQLIKNYNALVDLRDQKNQYLTTAMNLTQADRQAADTRFNTMFSMTQQIAQYQLQMQQNAVTRYTNLAQTIGWDGVQQSLNGDPYATSLVEKTMGWAPGTLSVAAEQAATARKTAQSAANLDNAYKAAEIQRMRDMYPTGNPTFDLPDANNPLSTPAQKTYASNELDQIKSQYGDSSTWTPDQWDNAQSVFSSGFPMNPSGAKTLFSAYFPKPTKAAQPSLLSKVWSSIGNWFSSY